MTALRESYEAEREQHQELRVEYFARVKDIEQVLSDLEADDVIELSR